MFGGSQALPAGSAALRAVPMFGAPQALPAASGSDAPASGFVFGGSQAPPVASGSDANALARSCAPARPGVAVGPAPTPGIGHLSSPPNE
eukprot:6729499-Prymnesium_polylepis.1